MTEQISKNNNIFKATIGLLLLVPQFAHADAGLPIIMVSYPYVLLGLIPVALIEGYVISKILKIKFMNSVKSAGISNAISTIFGFPLSWALLFGIQLNDGGTSCGPGFDGAWKTLATILLESAWICPWEEKSWILIPSVICVELIVSFFLSVYVEKFILYKIIKEHNKPEIAKANLWANISSYSFLISIMVIAIIVQYIQHLARNVG